MRANPHIERKERKKVLNIDIDDITMEELLPELTEGVVFTPNVDHLMLLQQDREFYKAYQNADLRLLDSQVLFLLMKLTGNGFRQKISGADLFPQYCEHHKNDLSVRIFILGGAAEAADAARKIINGKYDNHMVVASYCPAFGFEKSEAECRSIVDMVNSSGATVLVIGLGTPKQEKWIHRYKKDLDSIRLVLCVGAAVDFIAGKQKRAPKYFQKAGMEWFFRLILHPRRLFYRYVVRDFRIFYYLFIDSVHLYHDPFAEK